MNFESRSKNELIEELSKVRQRTAELETDLSLCRTRIEDLIHSNPAAIYTCKASGDFGATFVSDAVGKMFGWEPHDFTSQASFWSDHIHPDDKDRVLTELGVLFQHGHHEHEYRFRSKNGDYRWVRDECRLRYNAAGLPCEIVGYWIDIDARKRAEAALAHLVEAQQQAILELSTPAIQVWERILVVPLIGTLDTARAQLLLESLLEAIAKTSAAVAILDITGVPVVDIKIANHVVGAIDAARLLGAQVILTGVSPGNAQTLVKLGVDLGRLTTKGSLEAGLRVAFEITGCKVVKKS